MRKHLNTRLAAFVSILCLVAAAAYAETQGDILRLYNVDRGYVSPGHYFMKLGYGLGVGSTTYTNAQLNTALSGGSGVATVTVEDSITAGATQTQAGAYALTKTFNNVTVVAVAGDGVALPPAATGLKVTVRNSDSTDTLKVWPNNAQRVAGTSDSINSLAIDLSIDVPAGAQTTFTAKNATVWYATDTSVYIPSPTTLTGGIQIKAAANAGNTTTTITNASFGQATTLTIPDPGASTAVIPVADSGNGLALKGVTAGTVTASKGVVVSSNKDALTFRILGAEVLRAGADAVVGDVEVYPPATASGTFSLVCANQATNVASGLRLLGQAGQRTYDIPDAGGSGTVALDKAFVCLTAAGSAHLPASSSEIIITGGTKNLAAGALTAGNVIRFRATVKVNAINPTDTLTVRARIGAVTGSLTGTVVAAQIGGATTAANDIIILDGYIDMNSFSTPNMTMTGSGVGTIKLAGVAGLGTATLAPAFTLNTVNAVDLSITIQFSTSSGTNSATLHSFTHEIKAS